MKKIHIIGISIFSLIVLISILGLVLVSQKNSTEQTKLSDIQEISTTQKPETKQKEIPLTAEKQKQLSQISEIFDIYEDDYNTTLSSTLKKYKNSYSENDLIVLGELVEAQDSDASLKSAIKEKLSLSFLTNDIKKIQEKKEKLSEERTLKMKRLEIFQEKNKNDIFKNSQTLIEMTISNILSNQSKQLSTLIIQKIQENISKDIFEKNNIFDTEVYITFEQQETLLRNSLSQAITQFTSYKESEKKALTNKIFQEIFELGVLLESSDVKLSKDTSYFFNIFTISPILQKWGSTLFSTTYAVEDESLTPQQRAIALLKVQIKIEKIIQKSINTEIHYNNKEISRAEYNTQITENLVALEELVILKQSLENDEIVLSLDDIKRFDLGSYQDDSVEIQNLTALAYIQEKSGHIIVHNLNGSKKLGEENMLLYPEYSVETLDSSLTLVFLDESILRLEPYSLVKITAPSEGNINVEIARGNIWTRVLKPLLSGDTFTIETGNISLGVRGTSLYISKESTTTSIHIVDSYTSDGSPSVTLTQKDTGERSSLAKGKKVGVDNSGTTTENNENRNILLASNPILGDYIAEDLKYLSLILDDRKRGFYNTPLSIKNDGNNFTQKILGELEVSLPKINETGYIIKNPELASQFVNTGSIYHLVQKDMLITALMASSSTNKNLKKQAIIGLDMQTLEESFGNKRALENIFQYEIKKDIFSKNFSSAKQLKNIFLEFPISEAEANKSLLEDVRKNLSPNNGSNIVTENLSLTGSVREVTITWKSENPDILSDTGRVTMASENSDVILTATLSKGNLTTTKDFGLIVSPRQLTISEKENLAMTLLQEYLTDISPFGAQINITPTILQNLEDILGSQTTLSWIPKSPISDTSGKIIQPTYMHGPSFNEKVRGKFVYAQSSGETYEFTLPKIEAKEPNFQEILTDAATDFWSNYITSNNSTIQRGLGNDENYYINSSTLNFPKNRSIATPTIGVTTTIPNITISYNVYDASNNQTITTARSNYYAIPQTAVTSKNYTGTKKPHFDTDKTIEIQATFNLTGVTPITKNQRFIVPKEYTLVASTDYTNHYKLGILTPDTPNSRLPSRVGGGVELTRCLYQTGDPNNCAGNGQYLKYVSTDLSQNWAIEIDAIPNNLVSSDVYFLLNIEGKYSINILNSKIRLVGGGPTLEKNINTNNNIKIFLTNKGLYINGVLELSRDIILSNNENLYIGVIGSTKSGQWKGKINSVKIYKYKK